MDTATRSHVRWTPDEVKLFAERFLEERVCDMMAPVKEIIDRAQKPLAEDRRRPGINFSILNWEAQTAVKERLERFKKSYFEPITAAPTSPPVPEFEPAPATPVMRAEPLIIEFRVPKQEKQDLAKLLADVPTPVLYGFAFERMLRGGLPTFSSPPVPDVVRVEAQQLPEPTIIKANAVVDPPASVDGRRRVLVFGLLPTTQAIARDRAKNLLKLDVTFVDANAKAVPVIVVDYAILMRGIVTSFQAEQIRKRFGSKDRVFYCEVGLDELMSKLIELNSMP